MVLRYWVRFVILLIIAPLVLGAGSALYFRSYTGTASLWIETPSYFGQTVTPAGWNINLTPAENQSDILNELLSTDAFVNKIADRLMQTGAVTDDATVNAILNSMSTNLHVVPDGTHLVRLKFSNGSKAVCTAVLNVTIQLFQEQLAAVQVEQADLSTSFLSGQLKSARARLDGSQAALQKYLADHPGLTIASTPPAIQTDLDTLVAQARTDQSNVTQLQSQLDQAMFLGAAAKQLVATNTKLIDQPVTTKTGLLGDGSSLKRAALVALACLTVGFAYLLLLVWADKTARDARELDSRLKVPVLATVPRYNLLETL
jgi:capsular polysaccharide biosynthesis protein